MMELISGGECSDLDHLRLNLISIASILLIRSLVLVSNDVRASGYVLVNDLVNLWRERTIDEYEWSRRMCVKLACWSERAERLTRPIS